jgi:ornithine cyclodeaminase/alanine dehydrogenase-like protein (mu-crystallin family)
MLILNAADTGAQGRTQLEVVCSVRKIEQVLVFDSNYDKAKTFASKMAGHHSIPKDVQAADTAPAAVQNADIICTATTSAKPVFEDKHIKSGTHISAIGAYTPDMQEIPAETILRAKVIVDSRAASLEEAGDIIQPIRAGIFDASHIHAELGEIVLGRKTGRQSNTKLPVSNRWASPYRMPLRRKLQLKMRAK